ncbi:MAG: flagellar motor switch protein FliM [Deltaproteobacteria bacterium]|nr:flagellar motor switch protein FliM [Deltaproteobacteria bacterium]MBW2069721.1 flagellar motor switch protein FliM [Deltaproteobacteria bacterium]
MNKVLSQDEVNALLKGMSEGEVTTESQSSGKSSEVTAFDFADRSAYLKKRPIQLDSINERFVKSFAKVLTSALSRSVDVQGKEVEFKTYGEFSNSLPLPSSLHLFQMAPLQGVGLVVLESRLIFALLEAFFGASGDGPTEITEREFTQIESALIRKVVQMALQAQQKAWEPVHPVNFVLQTSETNPEMVNMSAPDEAVFVIPFSIVLEEPVGDITFCLAYSTLEPIRNQLDAAFHAQEQAPGHSWQQIFREHLHKTKVEVEVELGRAMISAGELLQLRPGDIIVLEQQFTDPVMAKVEGVPKMHGFAGVRRGKKAFRLNGLYEE